MFVLMVRMMMLALSPGASSTVALVTAGFVMPLSVTAGLVGASRTGLTMLVTTVLCVSTFRLQSWLVAAGVWYSLLMISCRTFPLGTGELAARFMANDPDVFPVLLTVHC